MFNTFTEQIFFATLRIELPSKQTMGTGFLIAESSKVHGDKYVFLVTNKHVLSDPNDKLRVVMHSGKGSPDLKNHIPIAISQIESDAYFTHPDENVDLACLNLSGVFNTIENIYVKTLELSQLASFQEQDLKPGAEILFVGYPEDRYDHAHNLPILRGGRVASLPQVDFEDEPTFLLDAPVFQGSSGSPVFTILDGRYWLIGVVAKTMIVGRQLQVVETATRAYTEQTIGIGLAYKSTCVKELIEYAVKSSDERRKEAHTIHLTPDNRVVK